MKVRKRFDMDELDRALARIAGSLDRDIRVFLIGGLAMMKQGLKASTKDMDMVFSSSEDIDAFVKSATGQGFRPLSELEEDYANLDARMVLEGPEGVRIDIFLRVVCGGLHLTPSMMGRASEIEYGEKLKVNITSLEDILLFKAITTRPDDLADMSILAVNVEWDVIEREARAQKDSWKWIARLYGRLVDLKDEYDVSSPLIRTLAEEAEIDYAMGIVVDKLRDMELSKEDIQTLVGKGDLPFVEKVIERLSTLDIVRFHDGVFRIG